MANIRITNTTEANVNKVSSEDLRISNWDKTQLYLQTLQISSFYGNKKEAANRLAQCAGKFDFVFEHQKQPVDILWLRQTEKLLQKEEDLSY